MSIPEDYLQCAGGHREISEAVLSYLAQGVPLAQWSASIFSHVSISAILLLWALMWAIIVQYCTTLKILLCCNILGQENIRLPSSPKKAPSRYHIATILLFDEYSSRLITLGVGSVIESILDLTTM